MQYIVAHKEALALVILLCVSELLPFTEKVKSNGIFQAVLEGLKKAAKPKAEEIGKE